MEVGRRQWLRMSLAAGAAVLFGAGVPTLQASNRPAADETLYRIQKGDTLSRIAQRHGVSVDAIRRRNGIRGDRIIAGRSLIILSAQSGYRYIGQVVAVTSGLTIPRDRWRYIVAHHSAIHRGNATSYDRFHREERRMENGLAYHFVIGNGTDSGDGEIEIGNRWHRQLQGGHVRRHEVNLSGIGICLIGNFMETRPTPAQIAAFRELMDYLTTQVAAPSYQFAVHREIDRNHTVCPGRHFPVSAMHQLYG